MTVVNSSQFRANMPQYFRLVRDNHAPVTVTTTGGKAVVVVSLEEWESLNETHYLASSPVNRVRLEKSAENIRTGKSLVSHNLIEA